MQKKLTLVIFLILSLILTGITVVFAWFTLVEKTQEIIIYSGSVKTDAKLYFNDQEIKEAIKYDLLIPGSKYDYKLVVQNLGTLDANLDIEFIFENNNTNLAKYFKLKYLEKEKDFNNNIKISLGDLKGREKDFIDTKEFYFTVELDKSLTLEEKDSDKIKIKNIIITLTQKDGDINE